MLCDLCRMELMKGIMVQQEGIIAQLRNAEQGVRTEYQVLYIHFIICEMQ